MVAGAEFWTDPAAAAATLHDGLTPDPETAGCGTVLFIDWQYSGSRDEYLDPGTASRTRTFTVANQAAPALAPGGWLAATVPAAGCCLPGAAAGPMRRSS